MGYFHQKPERNVLTDIIFKWITDVIVVMTIAVFLILFLGERVSVIGNSMSDKIQNGQKVLIDKMSYELREIKRFDVVVYKSDLAGDEEPVIKRIIGLPGERIQILDSKIYIDGNELKDAYYKGSFESGYASEEITLGKNEYFVMGDNRNLSQDSRFEYVGNINRKNILGRAWLIISPFNKISLIK